MQIAISLCNQVLPHIIGDIALLQHGRLCSVHVKHYPALEVLDLVGSVGWVRGIPYVELL